MFKACFGLLLRDDLHHAYDRLEWSLYHKVIEPSLPVRSFVPRFSLLPAARILLAVWEADTSRIGRHFLRPFLHTVSSKRLGAARKSHPSGPLPWHVKPMA
jgi:hypothetical protein